MGSCSRFGCGKQTYHTLMTAGHAYYICDQCESDLRDISEKWPQTTTRENFFKYIDAFMSETFPGYHDYVDTPKEIERLLKGE